MINTTKIKRKTKVWAARNPQTTTAILFASIFLTVYLIISGIKYIEDNTKSQKLKTLIEKTK